jgi:hypothetical protein
VSELTTIQLRDRMLHALVSYEDAKARFVRITDAYKRPGRHSADAEILAAGDPRRQSAAADCGFYGAEIQRYGTALIALTLTGGDS